MQIQFFETTDSALLTQYYELRTRIYRRHYPHLAEDFGREDDADRRGRIVVGYENRVVAGGRINISRPGFPQRMPMEESGFRLVDAMPHVRIDRDPYAEISRVTVDPAHAADRKCSLRLIQTLIQVVAGRGIDRAFSICPDPQVRWNAANSRKCGVKFQSFPNLRIPTPFHIPMTLCAYTGLIDAIGGWLGLTA